MNYISRYPSVVDYSREYNGPSYGMSKKEREERIRQQKEDFKKVTSQRRRKKK